MLYFLSAGGITDKEERETFTAVSILQQLNRVYLSNKIDNVVRLSHDDLDFYLDTEGKDHDLKDAFDKYEIEIDDSMSIHFKTLYMVLEHEDSNFKYLLETRINRNHEVGKYPIEIKISGFLNEFKATGNKLKADIKSKMEPIFSSSEKYEAYTDEKKSRFEEFVNSIKLDIQKFIQTDDVKMDLEWKMIIPKNTKTAKKRMAGYSTKRRVSTGTGGGYYDPMPYGYYGYNDLMLYTWLWSDMCHDHSIPVHNTEILSEEGEHITNIGADSVDASESTLFDSDVSYDSRVSGFDSDSTEDYHDTMDANDGGWFDSSDSIK